MNVGILGAGGIAQTMVGILNSLDGADAHAVASRDLEKARALADRLGVEKAYGSYEALLSDERVELVYVATPHSHHFEHARLSLLAGKHVLVEKAFTTDQRQARALAELARRKGLFLGEAMWPRFVPARRILREIIDSGAIGEVRFVRADLSYHNDFIERIASPETAGGALLDLTVYAINFAFMILGSDYQEVSSSCTFSERGVDAQESVTLLYPGGRLAVLTGSIQAHMDRRGIIGGSDGFIEVDNVSAVGDIRVYDPERRLIGRFELPGAMQGHRYQWMAALSAIGRGALEFDEMPISETLKVMRLMDELRAQWGLVYPFER